jgi:diaminohydroxyphosphoribosylaminopyrimidine deaminase/5-amino-6-(5-phosphoribosylamino)uracil reductase
MERALLLAEKARGRTSPNPMVGVVLVKGGRVVGEGYHRAAGRDHAEIVAIKKAKGESRRATLYVSLEPCCHTGSTQPCADAIIKAGIRKVVYAVKDPDPRVSGRGVRTLRKAGVEVVGGLLSKQARHLNEQFFGYHENGRPYVILKYAQSLDGRIATASGDSKWITGPQARKFAHRLRAEVDAVLVGSETVRQDDPALTVRHVRGANPYRVVVTSSLRLPRQCRLLKENDDSRTIIAACSNPDRRLFGRGNNGNLIFWQVRRTRDGLVDVADLVQKADLFGLRSLLVEGGARLATSFVKAGLVDKLVVLTAPTVIGRGVDAIGELGVKRLCDAVEVAQGSFATLGRDSVFIGYPKRST